jgi:hypothetical protein
VTDPCIDRAKKTAKNLIAKGNCAFLFNVVPTNVKSITLRKRAIASASKAITFTYFSSKYLRVKKVAIKKLARKPNMEWGFDQK